MDGSRPRQFRDLVPAQWQRQTRVFPRFVTAFASAEAVLEVLHKVQIGTRVLSLRGASLRPEACIEGNVEPGRVGLSRGGVGMCLSGRRGACGRR